MLILLIAAFCYKSHCRAMTRFCLQMTYHDTMRRFFHFFVMMLVIFGMFIHLRTGGTPHETLLPLCLSAFMLSHRLTESVFYWLKSSRHMALCMTAILVGIFTPHLYILGASSAIMMVGAIFYPSRIVRDKSSMPDFIIGVSQSPTLIHRYYY